MVQHFATKATSELPELSGVKTYKLSDVWWDIIGQFFAHFGGFAGCFFGIRSDGEWPVAWWAFCLLGNAFLLPYFVYQSKEATITREGNTLKAYNLSGKELWTGTMDFYEDVGTAKDFLNFEYIVLTRTDEWMMKCKEKHSWCSCCIGKKCYFAIYNIDEFRQDHGIVEGEDAEVKETA